MPRWMRPPRRVVLAGALGSALAGATGAGMLLRRPDRSGLHVRELLRTRPFYVAHRGGSADWPECSLLAYRESVARGIDALEIPLARSSDGVWFGLHDETLDRTSGTTGFVAADHSWNRISRYRIRQPGSGEPQPYLRFDDLVAAYADTHAIFVDPKATSTEHYPELLALLKAAASRPTDTFLAKSYGRDTAWAAAARAQGYRTWGYFYGREIDDGRTPLASTQADWDLLGLDLAASAADWRAALGYGRPVLGHVAATRADADRLLAAGAQGVVASGVREVLGR
jgi:glycerophosphoryl diester phosphodiesterase